MVQEETSIAEKIIKLFPREKIALNKKFNNRKPEWLRWWKKRKDMFKKHNFEIFWCNPILIFLNI